MLFLISFSFSPFGQAIIILHGGSLAGAKNSELVGANTVDGQRWPDGDDDLCPQSRS